MPITKEKLFTDALKDLFIGAKVEGISGYVNLMKIKNQYFEDLFPKLMDEINSDPNIKEDFREEFFDKLYDFFRDYFSEAGCVYFTNTAYHRRKYEQVYTDERDVILFWKTHMLYYVKSDILFKSIPVEIDNYKFYFNASEIENKKSNEKRSTIFEFGKVEKKGIQNIIHLKVGYSESGRKTKIDDIVKHIYQQSKNKIDEQIIEAAIKVFNKQNEVDYFINKNAREFLLEQLDFYLFDYMFKKETEFNEKRIEQIQTIKRFAIKIIDFISQFEDELVKIWNKPKFVLNSNYVISFKTLEKLVSKDAFLKIFKKFKDVLNENENYRNDIRHVLKELFKMPLLRIYVNQINFLEDYIAIDFLKVFKTEEKFNKYVKENKIKNEKNLKAYDKDKLIQGFTTHYYSPKLRTSIDYKDIYIDTKYFDSEFIESLLISISKKNNLNEVIDGYLIKGDNYQFLNTLQNKLNNSINLIYIDPPFNTESKYFSYEDKFKDSTWLSMMQDRLKFINQFLVNSGSFYLHLDSNCNYLGRQLVKNFFKEDIRREICWNTSPSPSGLKSRVLNWIRQHDTIFYIPKTNNPFFNKLAIYKNNSQEDAEVDSINQLEDVDEISEDVNEDINIGWLDLFVKDSKKKEFFIVRYNDNGDVEKINFSNIDTIALGDMWNNVYSMMYTQNMTRENWGKDNTQKPENLLRRIIQSSTNYNDFVLDFYLGSGTTAAAAHKLGRKWIGVEMGDYIDEIVITRLKTVLIGDSKTKLSEDINWKGGGFFKYFSLEQYEDTLKNIVYKSNNYLKLDNNKTEYEQYIFARDEKLSKAIKTDGKNADFDLNRIYPNIDIPETLSNLTGKWIKKITKEKVVFEDDSEIVFKNLNFKDFKPLIWW